MQRFWLICGLLAAVVIAAVVYFQRGDTKHAPAASNVSEVDSQQVPLPKTVQLQRTSSELASTLMDDDPEGALRLEGRVVDDTDHGVGGATVTLGSVPPRTVKTEGDGSFFFDRLVGRPYRLVAHAEQGVAGPVTARLTQSNEPVILRLAPAATIQVAVRQATDKQPVANATVELRGTTVRTTTTGPQGIGRFFPVVPSGYQIVAYAPGFARAHAWVRAPSGAVTAELDLELRRGSSASGRVLTPDRKPVAGASVLYSGASDWALEADPRHDAVLTDADGNFTFEGMPAGSIRFVARRDGFAPGRSTLTTLDGMSDRTGIDISLQLGATVRGKVVGTDNQPKSSSRVRVSVVVDGRSWDRPRQVYTDDKGEFVVSGLPQRALRLMALHETATSSVVDLDMTERADATVTLTLDHTDSIAGVVIDSEGEPVAGAQVVARPDFRRQEQADGSWLLRGRMEDLTNAAGKFELRGVEPGEYRLQASPPGVAGRDRLWVRDQLTATAGDHNVKIVLEPDGGIAGTVQFADGTAPEMFTIGVGFLNTAPFSGKDGSFEVRDLPPRKYTVLVRGPGFDSKQLPDIEVAAGELVDLGAIQVVKGRTISGRVTKNGSPVADATVQAGRAIAGSGTSSVAGRSNPFTRTKTTQTDEYGEFTIYGVGLGDLSIVAEHTEQGRSAALAIRGSRDSIVGLELPLQAFGALEGVVTKGGRPADAVRVTAQSQSVPGVTFGVRTGEDGSFRFDKLAPDTYKVSATTGGRHGGGGSYSTIATVVSEKSASVDISIDEGTVTVTVHCVPTNADSLAVTIVRTVAADIQVSTSRELELAITAAGNAFSAQGMSFNGNPVAVERVAPGIYTVCAIPYPAGLDGMNDTPAYLDREAGNLRVFCESVAVTAEPAEQSLELAVELPDLIPPPEGGS